MHFRFDIHVYHHDDPQEGGAKILGALEKLTMTIEQLKAQVTANTEVTQSAVTLISGLAAKIEELKNDPEELQALADELKGNTDALAAAVTTNTPAE